MLTEIQKQEMAEAIQKHVNEFDNVSFVEIKKVCDPIGGITGDRILNSKEYENVVLWADVNEDFLQIILDLLSSEKISIKPCHVTTYLIDRNTLSLPLVKRVTHYKNMHWLPVVFTKVRKETNNEQGEG